MRDGERCVGRWCAAWRGAEFLKFDVSIWCEGSLLCGSRVCGRRSAFWLVREMRPLVSFLDVDSEGLTRCFAIVE